MNLTSYPASTFGNIYHQALQSQLPKIGHNLRNLRKVRHLDIQTVAEAINLRPGILQQIENGQHNFRLKTLFALCDYYNTNPETIVNQKELLSFKIN
jgi:transcriptional regulator with XRE-family HTH domain